MHAVAIRVSAIGCRESRMAMIDTSLSAFASRSRYTDQRDHTRRFTNVLKTLDDQIFFTSGSHRTRHYRNTLQQ